MSVRIDKKFLNTRDIADIKNDCFVEGNENDYGPTKTLKAFGETPSALYIPFAYYKNKYNQSPNKDVQFPITKYQFYSDKYPFRTDGGRDQEVVFKKAQALLRKYRSTLLSLNCSFGKTFLGIRLAHSIGMKTAVLAHRGVLFEQWTESIQKFTNAKIQQVDTDGVLDPTADFYIFNIAFVHKRWNKTDKKWVPKKLGLYREQIGTLIVDEAHIACATELSRALLYFNPRNMIALTATPIREDGMDKTLELYFGEYSRTRIIRIAKEPFTVYRLPTGIKPVAGRNAKGRKDWNSLITSVIKDESRNNMIVNLIEKFKDNTILVLTKRTCHCRFLSEILTKKGVTNTVMVQDDTTYDKTARVLLSNYSKLGVGFDDTRLNMLIVACSVKSIEQYAGRLRDQVGGKERIIIDLVDDDSNCLAHWSERRKWYESRKGVIKHYYKVFPTDKGLLGNNDTHYDSDADADADATPKEAPKNDLPTKRLARKLPVKK